MCLGAIESSDRSIGRCGWEMGEHKEGQQGQPGVGNSCFVAFSSYKGTLSDNKENNAMRLRI